MSAKSQDVSAKSRQPYGNALFTVMFAWHCLDDAFFFLPLTITHRSKLTQAEPVNTNNNYRFYLNLNECQILLPYTSKETMNIMHWSIANAYSTKYLAIGRHIHFLWGL